MAGLMRAAVTLLAVGAMACGGGGDDADGRQPAPDGGSPAVTPEPTATPSAAARGVRLAKVADFDAPVYLTSPPGDRQRQLVVEQEGRVMVVRGGRKLDTPFLDIRGQVTAGGEQGMLSIAFAPDYAQSGLLYVYFTDDAGDQRIVEYRRRDAEHADPGSARLVLRMADSEPNHNGGLLLFGPDGQLYIGTGDGGLAGDPERNGQNLGSLLAKMLRIDPTGASRPYGIPSDNPFVNRPGARPEICNYGLRNPWRFSFDRETRALVIGDVGQSSQEEIDYVPPERTCGDNFGWSAFEGTERFNSDQEAPNAVGPILTYGRDRGCSVTGGYVVRDPALASLNGRYVYGDYCEGELRSFVPAVSGARGDRPLGLSVEGLVSFGEDTGGRIYAVSLDGPVYRLAPG